MSRLPIPGSDSGSWGTILNDFLLQAHSADGSVKPGSITNASIASSAVTDSKIQDGTISEAKLDSDVVTKLNSVGAAGPQGPQGPAGPAGVVVLDVNDPDPSPVVDGVLYIRLTGDIVDVTAPSVPTGLTQGTVTSSSIQATWSASTDNVGVTGYQLRLDGGSAVSTASLSYTFNSLSPSTSYDIEVRAGDAAGNWSAWSSILSVTTIAGGGLLFSDDFNRADGPAGNGWDSVGGTAGVNIASNSLALSGWANYGRAYQTGLPKAVSVRATFTGTLDMYQGIFLGYTPTSSSGLKLFNNGGTWVVGDANAFSQTNTNIAFVNTPSTPYTSLRLDFDGTTVTCYINGVVVHTATLAALGITLDTDTGNVYYVGYCGEAKSPNMDIFEVYEA